MWLVAWKATKSNIFMFTSISRQWQYQVEQKKTVIEKISGTSESFFIRSHQSCGNKHYSTVTAIPTSDCVKTTASWKYTQVYWSIFAAARVCVWNWTRCQISNHVLSLTGQVNRLLKRLSCFPTNQKKV